MLQRWCQWVLKRKWRPSFLWFILWPMKLNLPIIQFLWPRVTCLPPMETEICIDLFLCCFKYSWYFIIFVIFTLYRCINLIYIPFIFELSQLPFTISWTQIEGRKYIYRKPSFEKLVKYFCSIIFSAFSRVIFNNHSYSQMFQQPTQ